MKILTEDEFCLELKEKLVEGFALICIGSELRSDDRVAIDLCKSLKTSSNSKQFKILICEYGIENCIGDIIENNIKRMVLIDAAIINGLSPATIVLLNMNEIQEYIPYSTHTLPLPLLLKLLIEELKDVEIVIIGIVVNELDIGLELSPQIKNLISSLASCLSKKLR